MVDILDGIYPKGECKDRGKALVFLSYIEMMLQGWKFDESGNPIVRKMPKIYKWGKIKWDYKQLKRSDKRK